VRVAAATRPLLPLAAVTAGLASSASLAAEWVVTPSAIATTHAQQNPYLQPDEKSQDETSTGVSTQANLDLSRETERLSLSLHPSASLYRYPDKSQLDRDEEHLNGAMSWRNEKSVWGADVSFARDTTLTSELGDTGLTQGNQRHEAYGASLGPSFQLSERLTVQASVGSSVNRYPGTPSDFLENYRYDSVSTGLSYVLSDRALLSLSGAAGRLNSEGQGNHTDNASLSLGIQYALSPYWTVGAGAGPSLTRLGDTNQRGVVYHASLARSLEDAALSLSVSRSQQPSGSAIITNVEQAALSYGATLSERLTSSVTATYVRRSNVFRAFGLDLNRVRYARLETSLSWHVSPSWQIGAGAGGSLQKTSSFFVNDQTGRGYDVSLSLSWNGKPYVN